MILTIIVAADENGVIGLGNTLPWDMPADLKHFRERTEGHPVIMGRKTFDSIMEKLGHPLPNRRNIVITRQGSLYANDIDQVSSFEDAVQLAKGIVDDPSFLTDLNEEKTPKQGEAFVIGGQQIYELAMPRADKIELTCIHHSFDGDKFFPLIQESEWEIESEEKHESDSDNPHPYSFLVYRRRKDSADHTSETF